MKVCVFGAGNMGAGIAQVFLTSGHEVILCDVKDEFAQNGYKRIVAGLGKMVSKQKIAQEFADECLNRLTATTNYVLAKDAKLVLEAVIENMDVKKNLFLKLDSVCGHDTIFATNTSALSLTEMAASLPHRCDKFVGMHFFNPAPVMKLVEIIRAIQTSDETYDAAFALAETLGKQPVTVKEGPGFIVNRMLIPMMNEAIGILADGLASAEDIDKAMRLGANHPAGPLAVADLVGNDVNLAIMETLFEETGDSKYRPHPLLKKMVRAGYLGKKTRKGFFAYDESGKEIPGSGLKP